MKILHVIHTMRPEAGGVVEAVRLLATAHAAQGHPAEVVCLDASGTSEGLLPFPVHELGPTNRGTYAYSPALIPWLKAHRANYDAVITHGLWQYLTLATRHALRGTNTPYYVFPHGMLDPWFNQTYPLKRLKKQLYWRLAESRVLRDARSVLFTCEEERRLARESFRPYTVNEAVVGLGIEEPPTEHEAAKFLFQKTYPKIHDNSLLFLGRIDPKKGIDMLVAAYVALKRAGHPLPQLVLAGPGEDTPYADELRTLADGETDIHFAGMLKGDLKWGAIAACDALILPSHQENFGIVVAEALAMSKPVLISDKVNIYQEIAADNAGLIEADTLEGTRRLLKHWLALTDDDKAALRAAARPCYLKRFSIPEVAQRLVETMQHRQDNDA